MSDSEGRRLVGLARSVHALFSGENPSGGVPAIEPPAEVSSAVTPPPDVDMSGGWEPEVAAASGEFGPPGETWGEEDLTPSDEAAGEPALIPSSEAAGEAALTPSGDATSEAELTSPGGREGSADGSGTPLNDAVDAFVGGESGKAGEIADLAQGCIDAKDFEPVADAVARLVAAAGEPPDPTIYAVAEPLMSPVVLGRLARRMAAERDEARRQEHQRVCRVIGDDMAAAIRDHLAEATDRFARKVHCETLVAMGESGRRMIERMAHDDNRFLVRNAVAILGDTGGEGAVEVVTSALANPDARVRREALRALAKLGDPEGGALVVGMLDDPDPEVRSAAAVAVGELKVERALKKLISMLDDCSDPDESILLLRALGQLADPGAVASIEKRAVTSLFSKPRADVRIAAYRALNQIGTPHARRLLNQAVSDKDPAVKAAVREMLHMR